VCNLLRPPSGINNLRQSIIFIFLFLLLTLIGCSKDAKAPKHSSVPFVEYRDPFAGTYKGTLLKGWLGQSNTGPPPDTTYNFTDVISKAANDDSSLFVKYVNTSTHFLTDSKEYCYYSDGPRYRLSITFKNDSVHYYYGSGSWATWYYTYFTGKRQ
jgi:hypothetical protein